MIPALFEIIHDDTIVDNPTAIRVYVRLLRNPLIFVKPQAIKAWLVAREIHSSPNSVNDALNLLIARGYAMDHGRGLNNVRQLTLTLERIAVPETNVA